MAEALGGVLPGAAFMTGTGGEKLTEGLDPLSVIVERSVLGKKLFLQESVPACALCHTLQAAGAAGTVGPVLDELKPDAARVAKALRNGLGQMPSYKGKLTDEQIGALALFVSKTSGGAK